METISVAARNDRRRFEIRPWLTGAILFGLGLAGATARAAERVLADFESPGGWRAEGAAFGPGAMAMDASANPMEGGRMP